jgi:predicted nucleotidyltransferase
VYTQISKVFWTSKGPNIVWNSVQDAKPSTTYTLKPTLLTIRGTEEAVCERDELLGFTGVFLQKVGPYSLALEEIPTATFSERTINVRFSLVDSQTKETQGRHHVARALRRKDEIISEHMHIVTRRQLLAVRGACADKA